MFNPIDTPQGRYAMSTDQVQLTIDDLVYRNYAFNRRHSPNTEPREWACIYGEERISELERRFQLDANR